MWWRVSGPLLQGQLFALSAVIVLVTVLVLGSPATEADDEHSKVGFFGPESVFDARFDEELVVGFGIVDLTVQLQKRAVVEKMEQLVSNLVRMQTGAMPRADVGQIDRALLIAHHHVDVAPGALRFDCLFSVARVHGVHFLIFAFRLPIWSAIAGYSFCLAIFSNTPTAAAESSMLVPPALTNGRGMPFVGTTTVTTAMLIAA